MRVERFSTTIRNPAGGPESAWELHQTPSKAGKWFNEVAMTSRKVTWRQQRKWQSIHTCRTQRRLKLWAYSPSSTTATVKVATTHSSSPLSRGTGELHTHPKTTQSKSRQQSWVILNRTPSLCGTYTSNMCHVFIWTRVPVNAWSNNSSYFATRQQSYLEMAWLFISMPTLLYLRLVHKLRLIQINHSIFSITNVLKFLNKMQSTPIHCAWTQSSTPTILDSASVLCLTDAWWSAAVKRAFWRLKVGAVLVSRTETVMSLVTRLDRAIQSCSILSCMYL